METEKYYFRVGVFFLIVTCAFVYYLVTFGSGQGHQSLMRYATYFDGSVSGLQRGAPVKFKGIVVGLVDDIQFARDKNDRVLVTLDIDKTAPIRKDTIASIGFQGITGTTFLALENEEPDLPTVYLKKEKDQKYPVIKAEKGSLQASEMMGSAIKTSTQVQKLLSDKNILAVQGLVSETHDTLSEAKGALREIKMLARTLREDPSVIVRGTSYGGYKVEK